MDGGARGYDAAAMAEAERWLVIAGKLLEVRDLESCKKYAERAADTAPLLEGIDQLVATADVLLSAESQINGHLDWYAVLQLKPPSSEEGHELSTVRLAYRRLALLLHPSKNHYPGSDKAFELVSDCWAALSDPEKKRLYDEEVCAIAPMANGHAPERQTPGRSPSPPPPPASFWTICPGCFHAHEYEEEYEGERLLCPNCRRQFVAAKLPTPPPVVPGTGLYYCSWGLIPLGYSDCSVFPQLNLPRGTLCIPALPQQQQPQPPKSTPDSARKAHEHDQPRSGAVTRRSARLSEEAATLTPPSNDTRAQNHPFMKTMNLAAAVGGGPPAREPDQQLNGGGGGSQIHTRSSARLSEEAATMTPQSDGTRAQNHPFMKMMNLAAAAGGPKAREQGQQSGGGGGGSSQVHTRSSARLSEEAPTLTPTNDNNVRGQRHPFMKMMNLAAAAGGGPPAREQGQQFGGGRGHQIQMAVQDGNLASFADFVGRFDMNSFCINLDANSQGLGNLANLPFAP